MDISTVKTKLLESMAKAIDNSDRENLERLSLVHERLVLSEVQEKMCERTVNGPNPFPVDEEFQN